MRNKVENFFLWKWLLSIEKAVMIVSSIVVVLTIFASVICRYVLHINFSGSDEILIIFALWLYFVGGLFGGNYEDNHIKADVLSLFVSKDTTKYIFNIFVKAISLAVSCFIAVWAYQYFQFCLRIGGYTTVYHIPMMVSRFALVFGYIAPVLYNVYHFVLSIVEAPAFFRQHGLAAEAEPKDINQDEDYTTGGKD